MSCRLILAATAALVLAGPAFAQTAPAPAAPAPATPPAAEAPSAAEAEIEAKGEVFEARMDAMRGEMQAAVTAAAGDRAKLSTDLDAIVARYQPDADTFATELSGFIASQAPSMPEEQRAQMTQMGPMLEAQIKGAPAAMKASALESVATPAAPAAPATPQ